LGEVCEIKGRIGYRGYTKNDLVEKGEGAITLSPSNIQKNKFITEECTYISWFKYEESPEIKVFEGDILFVKTGSTYGKVALVEELNEKATINPQFVVLKDIKCLNKFLFYAMTTDTFRAQVENIIGGAATPTLSQTNLAELEIPLPPLPEQQRIVSILDECFAAIDKAKANAEQNLKNARELFEGYLQGVFEKKTSELGLNGLEDDRINKKKEILQSFNPKNPNSDKGDGWEIKPLKELTTKIGSGATPRGGQENYKEKGISLVRSMNVHDWEFKDTNLAFIDEKQAKELDGVTLQENDVLLNITGASVARCCVFPKEYLPARVNQHVSIIRPRKEMLDARFLNLLLTSKPYKDQLLFTGEQGATRQAITKAQIETFRISVPILKAQQTIVRQLDALRAETQKLEAIYQKKLLDLEELKKSVLQKAFRGKL